jgi:hypothetical protein
MYRGAKVMKIAGEGERQGARGASDLGFGLEDFNGEACLRGDDCGS